jgi:hypothetical protein
MLILLEPPEHPSRVAPIRWWHPDYVGVAAVLFAIAASLLGVALVVLDAT